MKTWPLQEAKNQFSRLVDLSVSDGPQTVTRHGKPVAVVISAEEFRRFSSPKETPLEFFSALKGSGIKLIRRKDLPRKIHL
jgi:antitoxin Phd